MLSTRAFKSLFHLLPVPLFLWLWFFPQPYWLCITTAALLVPAYLSFAILKPRSFDFLHSERPHGTSVLNVAGPTVLLSLGLLGRAMFDYHLLEYERAFVIAATLSLICGLGLWIVLPGARLTLALAVACLYAPSLLLHVNGFSAQTVKSTRATVVNAESWSKPPVGRVTLSIEGSQHRFLVGGDAYRWLKPGSTVCVAHMAGAVEIPIVHFSRCASAA